MCFLNIEQQKKGETLMENKNVDYVVNVNGKEVIIETAAKNESTEQRLKAYDEAFKNKND